MNITAQRAQQIINEAAKTIWDGTGLREQMTEAEQAKVTAAMFNARRNVSFNDVVRAIARGESL